MNKIQKPSNSEYLPISFEANSFATAKYRNRYLNFISFHSCCCRMSVVAIWKQDYASNLSHKLWKYSNSYWKFRDFIEEICKMTIQYIIQLSIEDINVVSYEWQSHIASKVQMKGNSDVKVLYLFQTENKRKNTFSLNPWGLSLLRISK